MTAFYRKDGNSGGDWRCERCEAQWTDHFAPGSLCNRPITYDRGKADTSERYRHWCKVNGFDKE